MLVCITADTSSTGLGISTSSHHSLLTQNPASSLLREDARWGREGKKDAMGEEEEKERGAGG